MNELKVQSVSKRFGGLLALDDVSLSAEPGRVTGLIGQNGAGKTTLLDVIAQRTKADVGRVRVGDVELTGVGSFQASRWVARAFQQLRMFGSLSVIDNVIAAMPGNLGESLWREVAMPRRVSMQRREMRDRAHAILDDFRLSRHADSLCGTLSYGIQKMVSLARLRASSAPVLLIDEPTSGLAPDAIANILERIRALRDEGRVVVLVEHDMAVMFAASDHIVVLNQGKVLTSGTPQQIRENTQVRSVYFGERSTP